MYIVRSSTLGFYALLALILGGGLAVIGWRVEGLGPWLGALPVLVIGWLALRKPLRRWRIARRPFPDAWRTWLEGHVPLYAHLDAEGRAHFERDVRFFLEERAFEGVQGVEVTDVLRLSVAAGAALLLHGRPGWELPGLSTILFYPDRFDDDYYDTEDAAYDGMAHAQGPVILSRRAVEESWAYAGDGSNVVLHELAHLFDFENAFADGTPSLLAPGSAAAWEKLVKQEMRRARIGKSLLRRYAATNPAELFAVAVENFFERPDALHRRHRALFDALVAFFNLDPRLDQDATPADEA